MNKLQTESKTTAPRCTATHAGSTAMAGAQLLLLLLLVVLLRPRTAVSQPLLWPLPRSFSSGLSTLTLPTTFLFQAPSSPLLDDAFLRYLDIIFLHQPPPDASPPLPGSSLFSLLVNVSSLDETLRFGTDESYSLMVPDPSNSTRAYIQANTVYGVLRGLETFSQLCTFNFSTQTVQVLNAPWAIQDEPRFPFRGLLIDTARHFQPLKVIQKVIDAMAYAKLNVLHWHIVDTQAFPLEIPSYPKLWEGSYSVMERYTIEDAKEIVEYARKRGINVMPELDVPGHAQSWGFGYPMLWPSPKCTVPLDVSRNFTFQLIDGVISDFSKVFAFDFFHMGGDEVNTSCWTETPHINKWLQKHNLTAFDAYKEFVLKAESISLSHGHTPVNWEEPFDLFGSELNKNTVIHNWLGTGVAPKVVKAGFRCIVSNQDAWYLDHLDVTWDKFYMNEPLTNITDPKEQKLVIGGEVCMWGETVDPSDIEQTIWPRAAAAAERLWSNLDQIARDPNDALPRLHYFRCLLNQRGVAAAPVVGKGRAAPIGPGSCYSQ